MDRFGPKKECAEMLAGIVAYVYAAYHSASTPNSYLLRSNSMPPEVLPECNG